LDKQSEKRLWHASVLRRISPVGSILDGENLTQKRITRVVYTRSLVFEGCLGRT
jgi:hypothetical protein